MAGDDTDATTVDDTDSDDTSVDEAAAETATDDPPEASAPAPEPQAPQAPPVAAPPPPAAEPVAYASQDGDWMPGWVTFAAVITFIAAGILTVSAIVHFADSAWLINETFGLFGQGLWVWGMIDAILAIIAFYAGWDILNRGNVGRVIAIIAAVLTAIRWLFFIPVAPALSIVIIIIDVLVIYALVNDEAEAYFRDL